MIRVPKWQYLAIASRNIAMYLLVVTVIVVVGWVYSHYVGLSLIPAALLLGRMLWALGRPAFYRFGSDVVSIVTSDDPDAKKQTYVLAVFPRRQVVRLAETTIRGGAAITMLLDNARVIVIPVEAREMELAILDMQHAYKVSPDEIFHLDSAPGQWPPPPKLSRASVRKPSTK
jgi:hypothetical protein